MANQVPTADKRSSLKSFFDPLERMEDEMERVLGAYFRGWNLPRLGFGTSADSTLIANLDVSETPETVQIVADVPGINEKDIDVTLNDSNLTIKGKRQSESEEKKKNYYRMERRFGEFMRRVVLPCEVDPNKVDAKLKDGVLTVTLQKTVKAMEQENKIPIKAA